MTLVKPPLYGLERNGNTLEVIDFGDEIQFEVANQHESAWVVLSFTSVYELRAVLTSWMESFALRAADRPDA